MQNIKLKEKKSYEWNTSNLKLKSSLGGKYHFLGKLSYELEEV